MTVKTDKTGKAAVLTKELYQHKMSELLDDSSTYELLKSDLTFKLQNSVKKIVSEMVKEAAISEAEVNHLLNPAPVPPRIYGVLKDHKNGMPLRPVVSTINAPAQPLAKFINRILRHVADKTKYNILNSKTFRQELESVVLNDNDILVSFDVKSLFTCIPLNMIIEAVMNRWDKIKEHTKISKHLFKRILSFLVNDCNYFMYNAVQ